MSHGTLFLLSAAETGRLFGLDQQTLIGIGIQLFNAAFLAAALSFLLYQPVRNFMRNRTEKIAAQLANAETDMAEAARLKNEYESKLSAVEAERKEILDNARALASDEKNRQIQEAKKEINILRENAAANIKREEEQLKNEISLYILDVSHVMASKFVAHAIDKETQDRMYRETIAELEGAAWPN
jgi:F-type H+-transporting ATPase subunit b